MADEKLLKRLQQVTPDASKNLEKESVKKKTKLPKIHEAVSDDSYMSKRYAKYDEFDESKKERLIKKERGKNLRYKEHKERVDAKRTQYADKLERKGIASREEAMSRFDSLRGITGRSNTNLTEIMGKFYGNENQNEEDFDAPDTSLGTAGFRM